MENQQPNESGKTFTQDDVNRIVGERLAKEKVKGEQELSKKEQELTRRELLLTAKETMTAKGLPVELLDALNCSDSETLNKSINIIEKHLKSTETNKEAPAVKFKGVTPGVSSGTPLPNDDPLRKAMGLS